MKRQPIEWEKIFANHVSYKGLIYEELMQFSRKNDLKIGRGTHMFPKKTYKGLRGT